MNRDLPTARLSGSRATTTRRITRAAICGVLGFGLFLSLTPAAARADSLDDQKKKLQQQLAQSKSSITAYGDKLDAAAAALQKSQTDLTKARAALSVAQSNRAAAQAEDKRLAGALQKSLITLSETSAAAVQAEADVIAQRQEVGAVVRITTQQHNDLIGYAALVTDASMGSIDDRLQWSNTIYGSTQGQLDRLTTAQYQVEAARSQQSNAAKQTRQACELAAQHLSATQRAESAAAAAQQAVSREVTANQSARNAVAAELATEMRNQSNLQAESTRVDQKIKERIAREKAAAAARERARQARLARLRAEAAAREKAAREAAAKRAKDAAAKQAAAAKAQQAVTTATRSSSSTTSRSTSNGLIRPVNAPITSNYGLRFHPILHYWRMHDGTDFGASCGTPMYAIADGVVTDRFWSGGYGNKLIVDFGNVNGTFITASYNHAQSYAVSPGQHVSQGQVLGYVGTTGLSTGCHLHFQLWANGTQTNPMNYLP